MATHHTTCPNFPRGGFPHTCTCLPGWLESQPAKLTCTNRTHLQPCTIPGCDARLSGVAADSTHNPDCAHGRWLRACREANARGVALPASSTSAPACTCRDQLDMGDGPRVFGEQAQAERAYLEQHMPEVRRELEAAELALRAQGSESPSVLDVVLEATKETRELGREVAARAAGARVVDLANVRHLMRLAILDTKLDVDLANLDALEAAADLLALPSSAIDEDRTSAARERLAAALERYRIASDAWLDGMIKARGGRHA